MVPHARRRPIGAQTPRLVLWPTRVKSYTPYTGTCALFCEKPTLRLSGYKVIQKVIWMTSKLYLIYHLDKTEQILNYSFVSDED